MVAAISTVVLLDPVADIQYQLAELQSAGESISELLHDGYLTIGNESLGRCCPPGVLVYPSSGKIAVNAEARKNNKAVKRRLLYTLEKLRNGDRFIFRVDLPDLLIDPCRRPLPLFETDDGQSLCPQKAGLPLKHGNIYVMFCS